MRLEPHHIGGRGHAARWDYDSIGILDRVCHGAMQYDEELEDSVFGVDRCERARDLGNQVCKFTLEDLEAKLAEINNWPRRDA